jgi:hypothetical protein
MGVGSSQLRLFESNCNMCPLSLTHRWTLTPKPACSALNFVSAYWRTCVKRAMLCDSFKGLPLCLKL